MKTCRICGQSKAAADFYQYRKGTLYPRCKPCHIEYTRVYHFEHQAQRLASARQIHQTLRFAVFAAYGGAKCACCGEATSEFLSLDHIHGGGAQERQHIRRAGAGYYRWLQKNGFPPGYQVLCHNCNMAKGFYGRCPHTGTTP